VDPRDRGWAVVLHFPSSSLAENRRFVSQRRGSLPAAASIFHRQALSRPWYRFRSGLHRYPRVRCSRIVRSCDSAAAIDPQRRYLNGIDSNPDEPRSIVIVSRVYELLFSSDTSVSTFVSGERSAGSTRRAALLTPTSSVRRRMCLDPVRPATLARVARDAAVGVHCPGIASRPAFSTSRRSLTLVGAGGDFSSRPHAYENGPIG